jgi:hypothetical protein
MLNFLCRPTRELENPDATEFDMKVTEKAPKDQQQQEKADKRKERTEESKKFSRTIFSQNCTIFVTLKDFVHSTW